MYSTRVHVYTRASLTDNLATILARMSVSVSVSLSVSASWNFSFMQLDEMVGTEERISDCDVGCVVVRDAEKRHFSGWCQMPVYSYLPSY